MAKKIYKDQTTNTDLVLVKNKGNLPTYGGGTCFLYNSCVRGANNICIKIVFGTTTYFHFEKAFE